MNFRIVIVSIHSEIFVILRLNPYRSIGKSFRPALSRFFRYPLSLFPVSNNSPRHFCHNEMKNRKRMRPPSSYIPWAGALRILPSQFFVHLPLKNSTITRLRSLWWSFARIFSILGKFLSGKDYPFDERFYFCVFFKCRRNDTSQCKIMRGKNYLSYLRKWNLFEAIFRIFHNAI